MRYHLQVSDTQEVKQCYPVLLFLNVHFAAHGARLRGTGVFGWFCFVCLFTRSFLEETFSSPRHSGLQPNGRHD